MKKNKITFANKEVILKNGKEEKSLSELLQYHKGSITTVLTFIMTNRAAVFLGGVGQDGLMYWLGKQSVMHPNLSHLIQVTAGVISVAWNALVANPTLCALIISALVAFGATVKWGIKKMKLNHDVKKAKAKIKNPNNEIRVVK